MPDDEVPSQDDAGNEPEEEPAPAEEPAAGAPNGRLIGWWKRRRRVATVVEATRDDEPPSASGTDEEQPAAGPKVHVLPEDPDAFYNLTLARHQETHDQDNKRASPPDGEHVTFRSVALAELYVGREIDALAAALQGAEWVNVNEQFAEKIAKARQVDDPYSSEFLLLVESTPLSTLKGYCKTSLPDGIDQIIGQLNVLGPSMISLVLTFVLTDDEASRLDKMLHDEETADVRRSGSGGISVKSVFQVKYERVQALLDKVGERCATWLRTWAPGTLGAGEGMGEPFCSLISLAKGTPCSDQSPPPDYLRLLDLATSFNARRFARPDYDYMFLVPRSSRRLREYVAAFNEAETAKAYPDFSVSPDILHREIFRYMVVLALEGILDSFESRMRATRSTLAILDLGEVVESLKFREKAQRSWDNLARWLQRKSRAESPTEVLRNQLLVLSRDVAVVCGDIKGAIDDTTYTSLWADYPLLVWLEPSRPSPPTRYPADVPRKGLTEAIAKIKAQETELRELVLVTNQAVSEDQDKKTQRRLNRLTWALVGLTVVLVFLGAVTLYATVHAAAPASNPSPVTHASTPVAKPTVHPKVTPKPSTSVKTTQTHKVSG